MHISGGWQIDYNLGLHRSRFVFNVDWYIWVNHCSSTRRLLSNRRQLSASKAGLFACFCGSWWLSYN